MKISLGILAIIIVFLSGLFVGRKYFPKREIVEKEVKVIVHETKWLKPNLKTADINNPIICKELQDCYNSPLKATWTFRENFIKDDLLTFHVYDSCKSADIDVKLARTRNFAIYFGIGFGAAAIGYLGYTYRDKIPRAFR